MNKEEIQRKIREIVHAYQLIVDIKQELYDACPKEKHDELYEELKTLWCGSDIEVRARKVQKIIGAGAKKSIYTEPALCYDEHSKMISLTAKNTDLEINSIMKSDPGFIENLICFRTSGTKPYSPAVKIVRTADSPELEVFLYGDFEEDGNDKVFSSSRRFVKKVFEKKKD